MITPVLIASINWGTYLFFAVLNALFIPIIYFVSRVSMHPLLNQSN